MSNLLLRTLCAVVAATPLVLSTSAHAADVSLDYEFFKARVQPIFLKKRDNHVRCYVCHSEATNAFKLVHMEKGQTAYTEEDTRKKHCSDVHAITQRPMVENMEGLGAG